MTGSKRRAGSRRGRLALLGVIAATATMAVGAGSAKAAVFNATFDDAALSVGGLAPFDILDPPDTATMTGTVDGAGAVNVPANQFVFPEFSGDALPGVPVTVNFSAVDPIVGTLNLATGVMTTTTSTYHANVVALGGDCDYDIEQAFSTAAGSPFNGDPFTVNGTDPVSITNGVLQTSWPMNHFGSGGAGCATIDGLVNSQPGGLAMGNGFDLTPAAPAGGGTTPPPATPVQKKKKKCKKKKAKKGAEIAKKKCKKKKKK